MGRDRIVSLVPALLLVLAPALQGCVEGRMLRTEPVGATAIEGTFTALLYGCRYPDDIENAAILVSEGSKYPLEIYSPASRYKVRRDLSAQQALAEANAFVKCGVHTVWQTQVRRILDDSGGTVGYEVRPLYYPYDVGAADVLLISYALKDGKIRAYIRLIPEEENRPFINRHPGFMRE